LLRKCTPAAQALCRARHGRAGGARAARWAAAVQAAARGGGSDGTKSASRGAVPLLSAPAPRGTARGTRADAPGAELQSSTPHAASRQSRGMAPGPRTQGEFVCHKARLPTENDTQRRRGRWRRAASAASGTATGGRVMR